MLTRNILFAVTTSTLLAVPAFAQMSSVTRNGLPPTTMDSFVHEAGGNAESIYGDEGTDGIPPYFGFDFSHRINKGIVAQRDKGLTTGHGSMMPSAWGADEFLAPPGEMSLSGTNNGNPQLNNADAALNVADQAEATPPPGSDGGSGDATPTVPSPGQGYQPISQHGEFVGWMSPAITALMQTDQVAGWIEFANSPDWVGSEGLKADLLYEVGAITFDQMVAMGGVGIGF
jgi:hypothetical protein